MLWKPKQKRSFLEGYEVRRVEKCHSRFVNVQKHIGLKNASIVAITPGVKFDIAAGTMGGLIGPTDAIKKQTALPTPQQ